LAVVLLRAECLAVDGELGFADSVGVSPGDGVVGRVASVFGCDVLAGWLQLYGRKLSVVTVVCCIVVAEDNVDLIAALFFHKQVCQRCPVWNKLSSCQFIPLN